MSALAGSLAAGARVLPRGQTGRTLLRGGALVFASTLAWHASNFAFNAVTARLLGPSGYAELAATVSLLYVASPVLTSIQTMTSRVVTSLLVAGTSERIRPTVERRAARIALVGVLAALACASMSHEFARFLHLSSGWPIVIVCAGLCVSAITHCQRGALQGAQRFGRYSLSTLVEASVKVLGVVLLVGAISHSVDAAVAAVPLAAVCALVVNSVLLRFLPKGGARADRERLAGTLRQSSVTVVTFVCLSVLLSADILAAKRYLPSHLAGVYAVVSLSGKIVFFSTSALSFFLFPFFSERRERNLDGRRQLGLALGLLCGCSAIIVGAYALAPRLVVDTLFGSSYATAGAHLIWIGIAFSGYAVAYLAATYLLAQGTRLGTVVLGGGTLLQLAALYMRHASIGQIVEVQLVVFWSVAVLLCAIALRTRAQREAVTP
jgi:O-antigen/teichoic acid export membrane protein